MKGHCDLGHEDSIASASSFLGSPHETWCPLNGEEKIRSSQTPPPNSRGDSSPRTGAQHALRDSPLTCSHTLGTEQITANDMVPAQWELPLPAIQRLFVPPTIFFLCFKDKKTKLDSHCLQSTMLFYGALKDFSEIPQCLPLRKPESEDDLRHAQVGNDFQQILNFDMLMCR